jgi:hypothetical protein
MTETERRILAQYSTPGLRRNELTRAAKREHLAGLGLSRVEIEKTLLALYGPDPSAT